MGRASRSSSFEKTATGRSRIWTESLVLAAALATLAGCGGPCKDIAAIKTSLTSRQERAADDHAVVRLPLDAANGIIAQLLEREPALPLELPSSLQWAQTLLGPLSAVPRVVVLRPSKPGFVRFFIEIELREGDERIVSLELEAEVEPELRRDKDGVHLTLAISPEELARVRPKLTPGSKAELAAFLTRRVAEKTKVPALAARALVRKYTGDLAEKLGGKAFAVLREMLLRRVAKLSRIDIRLPDMPIADVRLTSRENPDALELLIQTTLPVRRGLAPASTSRAPTSVVSIRVAGSTAAELANWAVDEGHLPQHYTRKLKPEPDGKYRPILDWRDNPKRPLAVHVFQERGGCSHFRVGLRPALRVDGDQLVATVHDRKLERVDGSAALEMGAWIQSAVSRSVDRSRRAAAHTRVSIGDQTLHLKLTDAAIDANQLDFAFQVGIAPSLSTSQSWGAQTRGRWPRLVTCCAFSSQSAAGF